MLVLSRKVGEKIRIADNIVITIIRVTGGTVRIGIEAPTDVPIHRQEVADGISASKSRVPSKG